MTSHLLDVVAVNYAPNTFHSVSCSLIRRLADIDSEQKANIRVWSMLTPCLCEVA